MKKYLPPIIGFIIFIFLTMILAVSLSKQTKLPMLQQEIVVPTVQPANSNNLTVSQPQNGITVKKALIQVIGKTTPNAEVFVNDKDTVADTKGNFSVDYMLEEGENYILVGATDSLGKFSEKELSVKYTSF